MEVFDIKDMHKMLHEISDLLISNEKELCKLDSYIGDGDHGITISRGFKAVKARLDEEPGMNIKELFIVTGGTLSEKMGGAIGPIFGGIFTSMGEASDSESIDIKKLAIMLREGLENVMIIGDTKRGDRTLVDALHPAVESLEADAKKEVSLLEALDNAAEAARKGVEETKTMIAKKGRAKFLQEKSLGYPDAGAKSMSLVFSAIADYCRKYA